MNINNNWQILINAQNYEIKQDESCKRYSACNKYLITIKCSTLKWNGPLNNT